MNAETNKNPLIAELKNITRVIEQLIDHGAQVREIRLHGRARPAIMLNRGPQSSGNAYAWGTDQQGRYYERRACTLDGVQIQWETYPKAARPSNILPFPLIAAPRKTTKPWLSEMSNSA